MFFTAIVGELFRLQFSLVSISVRFVLINIAIDLKRCYQHCFRLDFDQNFFVDLQCNEFRQYRIAACSSGCVLMQPEHLVQPDIGRRLCVAAVISNGLGICFRCVGLLQTEYREYGDRCSNGETGKRLNKPIARRLYGDLLNKFVLKGDYDPTDDEYDTTLYSTETSDDTTDQSAT